MSDLRPASRELETERLILRQLMLKDLDELARFSADETTMQFMGGVMNRENAFRSMAMLLGHWQLRNFGMWAVVEKSSNQFVGRIGLHYPDGWPGIEVGWLLGRDYWGKGYATEAAIASYQHGFESLEIPHLISLIHPDNQRSIRVAERIGLRPEGKTIVRDTECIMYGIKRTAFAELNHNA